MSYDITKSSHPTAQLHFDPLVAPLSSGAVCRIIAVLEEDYRVFKKGEVIVKRGAIGSLSRMPRYM
jgi:hypothetical protein